MSKTARISFPKCTYEDATRHYFELKAWAESNGLPFRSDFCGQLNSPRYEGRPRSRIVPEELIDKPGWEASLDMHVLETGEAWLKGLELPVGATLTFGDVNRIADVYKNGVPLYWRDEESGELPAAVEAYLNHVIDSANPKPSEVQIRLLRDYLTYYINAPIWERPFGDELDPESREALKQLREMAPQMVGVEDFRRFTHLAADIGMDPL